MNEYNTIKSIGKNKKSTTSRKIVEINCEFCGYDRGILTYSSYASRGSVVCNNPYCERIHEYL